MCKYDYATFIKDVETIAKIVLSGNRQYDGIYGIPQGGVPFAMALSHKIGIPQISVLTDTINPDTILVVDDLIDSGKTLKKYSDYDCFVLGIKNIRNIPDSKRIVGYARTFPAEWIHFWWEPEDTLKDPKSLVTRMLEYIGEDPNRKGLVETPKRVVKMWGEIFSGMKKENRPRIQTVPNGEDGVFYDEMLRDSGYFFSCCEHHLIPFFGDYYFGYIPNKTILGASKIGRLIDYYAARPQIAERLANQVINDIEKEIKPYGSILIMKARHLCKEMRGLKKHNSPYEAIATRGYFRTNENRCKDEFMLRLASDRC